MTPERQAQLDRWRLSPGEMLAEIERLEEVLLWCKWRPIAEIHEDYGQVILVNIDDPAYMEIGGNLDHDFDAGQWTHFVPVPSIGQEEYGRMCREAGIEGSGE